MFNKKISSTAIITAFSMFAFAAQANAADVCPGQSASALIAVNATGSVQTTGKAISYSYNGCHRTTGDRYTVQVTKDYREQSGQLVKQPMTELNTVQRAGQTGSFNGNGSFTPQEAGRYVVRVIYYRQGQEQFEADAEAIIRVQDAPVIVNPPVTTPTTPVPPPTVTNVTTTTITNVQNVTTTVINNTTNVPVTPVQPTPQPQPTPVGQSEPTPVQPAPVQPQPVPVGQPEPVKPARIALTKVARSHKVKAGKNAVFTLTVKSTGEATAENVKVCDRIPASTQFVTASVNVKFEKGNACYTVGDMKPGQSKSFTITLKVDTNAKTKRIWNTAIATATNAPSATAKDWVKPGKATPKRIKAPVTG